MLFWIISWGGKRTETGGLLLAVTALPFVGLWLLAGDEIFGVAEIGVERLEYKVESTGVRDGLA
jgi:hypothetical protein